MLLIHASGTAYCDFGEPGDDTSTLPEISVAVFLDTEPGTLDLEEDGADGNPQVENLKDGVKTIGSCDIDTGAGQGPSTTRRVMNSVVAVVPSVAAGDYAIRFVNRGGALYRAPIDVANLSGGRHSR